MKKPTPRSIGKELWTAEVEHRRKFDRYSDGQGWKGLSESQKQGWDGVASYVMKNFTRTPAKTLKRKTRNGVAR